MIDKIIIKLLYTIIFIINYNLFIISKIFLSTLSTWKIASNVGAIFIIFFCYVSINSDQVNLLIFLFFGLSDAAN